MGRGDKKNYYVYLFCILVVLTLFGYIISHPVTSSSKKYTILNQTCNPPSRRYHRCTTESIPYVSSSLETAQYLLTHPRCSFARFGDGEVDLIKGVGRSFQHSSESLSAALFETFSSNYPDLMIGIPDIFSGNSAISRLSTQWWESHDEYRQWFVAHCNLSRQYLNAKITSVYVTSGTRCTLLSEVYSTLREIWKDKDIVLLRGNNSQVYEYDVYDSARSISVMYASRYEAWDSYLELRNQLLNISDERLFILTAGPVSKVLVLDLYKHGRRALDLGHLAKDYDVFMGKKTTKGFMFD